MASLGMFFEPPPASNKHTVPYIKSPLPNIAKWAGKMAQPERHLLPRHHGDLTWISETYVVAGEKQLCPRCAMACKCAYTQESK